MYEPALAPLFDGMRQLLFAVRVGWPLGAILTAAVVGLCFIPRSLSRHAPRPS
jgi:hypothetical protein